MRGSGAKPRQDGRAPSGTRHGDDPSAIPSPGLRLWAACRGPLGVLLLLAVVWGQTIAPLAALRMAAAPPGLSAICGHEAAAGEDAVPAAPGCRACPLCTAGLAVPVVPDAPPVSRRLRWSVVAFPIPPPVRPAPPPRATGQPRAPPTPL